MLSAGTFFGALIAGDLADYIGRRWTIISGCGVFIIGCVLQTASSDGLGLVSLSTIYLYQMIHYTCHLDQVLMLEQC